jgi:glutaconate CoA-transferase subunit A
MILRQKKRSAAVPLYGCLKTRVGTMNKLQSLQEAVGRIESDMTIGIGGWGPRRKPMALVRELLRSDVKDLTVVSYGGADVGRLCAAGKVKKLVFAFVSLDFIPLEPYFREARQKGAIEVMEIDEGMMLLGLRAAAWNIPFIPTAIGLGTDVITRCPDLKVIDSPYDDKAWVAMPALKLDASLIHVDRADARGVCQIKGPDHYMDDWFARAANTTIVSCDELVEPGFFTAGDEARYVFLHAVVWIRCGAFQRIRGLGQERWLCCLCRQICDGQDRGRLPSRCRRTRPHPRLAASCLLIGRGRLT